MVIHMTLRSTRLAFAAGLLALGLTLYFVARANEMAAAGGASKLCTDLSRQCVIQVAQTHIDAHADSTVVPRYSKNLKAVENGLVVEGLPANPNADPYHDQRNIWRVRAPDRVWVDGDEAIFSYLIDLKDPETGEFAKTAHIFERFKVEKGQECAYGLPQPCITEIEAIFCVAPHALESAWPRETPYYDWRNNKPSMAIVCDRKG